MELSNEEAIGHFEHDNALSFSLNLGIKVAIWQRHTI